MQVQHRIPCLLFLFMLGAAPHRMMAQTSPGGDPSVTPSSRLKQVEITGEQLRDKIRGGMLGQMLGNLNGLVHEMKYIHEPGQVTSYVPELPEGARTDDDTDFEWVYVVEMQAPRDSLTDAAADQRLMGSTYQPPHLVLESIRPATNGCRTLSSIDRQVCIEPVG